MSWAAIAKRNLNQNEQKPISKIQVQYNILPNIITNVTSNNIPRQKEKTPHPADDFLMTNNEISDIISDFDQDDIHNNNDNNNPWPDYDEYYTGFLDYTKDENLKQFKQSLPISVQCMIDFAHSNTVYGQVIDLNFPEINKDLKLQFKKYNGDQKLLKKLYYNRNPEYNGHNYIYYTMFFGRYHPTLIDYIFSFSSGSALINDQIKVFKQLLKYLKLLIINNIINLEEFDDRSSWNITVWHRIKDLVTYQRDKEYSNDIMDDIFDLITSCVYHLPFDEQGAMLTIIDRTYEYTPDYKDTDDYEDDIYINNLLQVKPIEGDYSSRKLKIKYEMIEKLLFRGILPFQIIEEKVKIGHGLREMKTVIHQPSITNNDNETSNYLNTLLKEANIDKNMIKQNDAIEDDFGFGGYGHHRRHAYPPYKQMYVLSPLILLPYFNRAKNMMLSLVCECVIGYTQNENLSKQISNVISSFIFVDYDKFYDIKDNINAKCVVLLANISLFPANNNLLNGFIANFDIDCCKYLKENYWNCFMNLIAEQRGSDHEKVIQCIKKYNKMDRFPIKPNGIYIVFSSLIEGNPDGHEKIIEFFKYCKSIYRDDFDINLAAVEGNGDSKIIEKLIWRKSITQYMEIINFIFDEFGSKYDLDNPCLLYMSFERIEYQLFESLMKKFKNKYNLEYICDTLKQMMDKTQNQNITTYSPKWVRENHQENREFLEKIQKYCLEFICSTEDDKTKLNECMVYSWKVYAKCLHRKYKKW